MNVRSESQQFGALRARIESAFRGPAIVVVSSAQRGDGKSVTAFGLAVSLASADHRVLLIDANAESPTFLRPTHRAIAPSLMEMVHVGSSAVPIAGQRFRGLSLADRVLEAGMSIEKLRALVTGIKHQYDYTIVDTGTLVESNLALLFATVADATLLTVRSGRIAGANDEETVNVLSRTGASVLGAFLVSPKSIKAFRERAVRMDDETHAGVRAVGARAVESVSEVMENAARTSVIR